MTLALGINEKAISRCQVSYTSTFTLRKADGVDLGLDAAPDGDALLVESVHGGGAIH